MLGKPKFKINDKVQFDIFDDRDFPEEKYTLKGYVYIVDSYGTFGQNEEPSYDIMVDEGEFPSSYPCLFKHIRESRLKVWD